MQYIDYNFQNEQLVYDFSYSECKMRYEEYCSLSDDDFIEKLPEILHFSCFVSHLKELHNNMTLSDNGIIHELVHLLHLKDKHYHNLAGIRRQFEEVLKLS